MRGGSVVRGNALLITIFAIAAVYGVSGVGFDRLWVAQFYANLGFPATGDLGPVVWLGIVRTGAPLVGIVSVEIVRRSFDPTSHAAVSRALMTIYVLQLTALAAFGLAQSFVFGMVAFWAVLSLHRAYVPLYTAWINQNVDSSVRATVLSMGSQVSAMGQIAGGPAIGALGSLVSLRAALLTSAGVMSLALPLFLRASKQGAARGNEAPEAQTP
jgi:DHA3 family tetracycline resistance protein-like MFS transporter